MLLTLSDKSKKIIIERSVSALERGGIVVYPSDTVYGIAVDASNPGAVKKLDLLKNRKLDHKYSLNFSNLEMIKKFRQLEKFQEQIIAKYLPGPYTFILDDNLSIRIPQNSIITEIVSAFGRPATGTSANLTGKPPATTLKNLAPKIYLAADIIIDDPGFKPQKPSTVVDIRQKESKIIRLGKLSYP
ncbi:MAG: L-threonylcarbamoyladenylate synthase [Candidatus Berkelbacteria bacterium]|nr:L-threonylcarbamoyladenylate synthase [Candidatus Berkelbacteria bacterium]